MAQKQLEILVIAQDQATTVFRNVGNAAGETGSKLGSLNNLAGEAKGFRSLLRNTRNLFIAMEVIPVGVDAVKAAFASMSGSAEEAATAQRTLYNAIKEIPFVGKPAAEAAESLGAALAHFWGAESTAEVEESMAKKKAALADFAKAELEFKKQLDKENVTASMVGLFPSEQEIVKAKNEYAAKVDEIKAFKKHLVEAAAAEEANAGNNLQQSRLGIALGFGVNLKQKAGDYSAQLKQLNQMQADADKIHQNELNEAHVKEIQAEEEFNQKLADLQQHRLDALKQANEEQEDAELDAAGMHFEAKINRIYEQSDREIAALRAGLQKENEERRKQIEELTPQSQAGNKGATKRIEQLEDAGTAATAIEGSQEDFARKKAQGDAAAAAKEHAQEADNALQEAKLEILTEQAHAGNQSAKAQLEEIEGTKKQSDLEKSLLAILKDQTATQQQQIQAQEDLNALKAAQQADQAKQLQDKHDQTDRDLMEGKIEMLRREGEMGDKAAAKEAEKLEIQQRYNEEQKKLTAILNDRQSTDAEKAEAQRQMAQLGTDEQKELAGVGKKKGGANSGPQLAQLDVSQFLTGVSAKAQQEKSDPALDEAKKQTGIMDTIASNLSAWLSGKGNAIPTQIKFRN